MSRPLVLLPALAAVVLAPSCVFRISGHDSCIRVDGVTLEEQHQESLDVDAWGPNGLRVDAAMGDLSFEPTDGPSRVVATLHERELGDASLAYRDGALLAETTSGDPAALGQVTVFVNGELPSLHAWTGSGDVTVTGLHVAGAVSLSTGMGDLDLIESSAGGKVSMSSGMGDVTLRRVEGGVFEAESGMGDVTFREVDGTDAALGSGMGDVTLKGCAIDRIDAGTGMGDVTCRDSQYVTANLDSGLGSVSRD